MPREVPQIQRNYPAWNINIVEVEKWEMLPFKNLITAYFLISSLLFVPLLSIQLLWCCWTFHFLSHFQIFINTVLSTWNTLCSPFPPYLWPFCFTCLLSYICLSPRLLEYRKHVLFIFVSLLLSILFKMQ